MPIALTRVEEELAALRRDVARANNPGTPFPDIRATVATLVLWCGDADAGERGRQTAVQISSRHPVRTVVVVPGDGPVTAEMSAQCAFLPGGERQVCTEQVVLSGGSHVQAASAAEQLLLPDVPVVVWSLTGILPSGPTRLIDAADRLVVDTEAVAAPARTMRALWRLRQGNSQLRVADLEWIRLSPWRDLLAQVFDLTEWRGWLDTVHTVQATGPASRPHLLAGWVAASLRRPIDIDLGAGATGLTLRGDGGVTVTAPGSDHLVVRAGAMVKTLPLPACDTVDAMSKELARVGQDHAFLGALQVAVGL